MGGRGSGQLQESSVFQTRQGGCKYEVTESGTACTRPAQARKRPSIFGGGCYQVPLLSKEELLVIGSFQKNGEFVFFKDTASIEQPYSSGWPLIPSMDPEQIRLHELK